MEGTHMTLCCPQCGGLNVGRRTRPLLINLVVFLVLFVLLRVARLAFLPGLFLSLFVIVPFSFFCLFATGAIAIASKRRCRDCGYRLGTGSADTSDRTEPSFPTGVSALGVVILFASLVMGRPLILGLSGVVWWVLIMEAFMAFILCGVVTGLLLIGQAVVYRLLHKCVQSTAAWAVLMLLPVFGLAAGSIHWSLQTAGVARHASQPEVKARTILEYGRLASLPASATDIRVHNWSSPFSGEWYLRFHASAADIDKFLAESPSLQGQQAEVFTRQHMRLAWSLRRDATDWPPTDANTYFPTTSMTPEWFKPEIRERGRGYGIPAQGHHNWGEVIVNDATHVVYVRVVWS